MASGFQVRTVEYRWGVVNATEPKGVRTIRGYIAIFEYQNEVGTLLSRRVVYQDAEGRPFQSLAVEDVDIFYDATQAALVEMGLRAEYSDRPYPAGDIIR